jgi:small-conductance mechanosensitive channel
VKTVLWLIRKSLFQKSKLKDINNVNTYSLYQIIRSLIWVIVIARIFETIGIKLTLLVGIGLGLQQTFNDVISGIILL